MITDNQLKRGRKDYKEIIDSTKQVKEIDIREIKDITEVILSEGKVQHPLYSGKDFYTRKTCLDIKNIIKRANKENLDDIVLELITNIKKLESEYYNYRNAKAIRSKIEADYQERESMYLDNVDVETVVGFIYRLSKGELSKLNQKYFKNDYDTSVGVWCANVYELAIDRALKDKEFYQEVLKLYQLHTRDEEFKRIEKIKKKFKD